MDEMEEKLAGILNNPQMMQQIMSMAQSMGSSESPKVSPPMKQEATQKGSTGFPDIDFATIQKITGLAQQSNIDKREKALLGALGAYLSKERLNKLEKAMRAAKIAKIASSALNGRGIMIPKGR